MQINWTEDKHPLYLILNGDRNKTVRRKPTPNGKYLWSYGRHFDYADSIEDAKEQVEGLAASGAFADDLIH